MRFERLRLRNWRNFKNVDVQLADRVFIVGQNASGKSNLLDVFKFLHDLVMPGGGFIKSVEERGGLSALKWFNARRTPNIEIEITVRDAEGVYWRYEVVLVRDRKNEPILKKEMVQRFLDDTKEWRCILHRPSEEDKKDPGLLKQTHIEQRAASSSFSSLVDVFRSISYVHLVPQILRRPDMRRALPSEEWLGTDLIQRIAKTNSKTRKSRLKRISKTLSSITGLNIKRMFIETKPEGAVLEIECENWRKYNIYQTEQILSDGTLRTLGLLWSLLEKGGPLLWEEPEQSLHPAVVRRLPGLIARLQGKKSSRQVLITTHSPDLLYDKGIGAEEILLLIPDGEKTDVQRGADIKVVKTLLEQGERPGEVAIDYVQPKQKLLFP